MVRDVSWSELDTLRQCPHKHTLAWRQGWVPPKISPALAKGDLFHKVMEVHYDGLQREYVGLDEIYEAILPLLHGKEGEQSEVQDLVTWMYKGYLDYYGVDEKWELVAVEHQAQCWLPTPSGRKSQFRFNMKIDLIIKVDGKLWLVDHKTGKDLPTDKELALADQFGLYVWGMRQLGRPIHGVIYNAIRTQRNKGPMEFTNRMQRTLLYRTDKELDRIAMEAYQDFKRAFQVSEELAPRHPNVDTCRWRCPFTEACLSSRKATRPGTEMKMLADMGFVQDFGADKGSRTSPFEVVE